MNIVCLDMEGVLIPEIWIAFADAAGIPQLRRTTREEPDYEKLMRFRIGLLKEKGLTIHDIQKVIETIDLLPGAKAFLDELRSLTQVIVLSDSFDQFAMPFMKKLGYPTLFCNTLLIGEDGMIEGFQMRCPQSKLTTVRGLQAMGFSTIASGDSYNDMDMIKASKAGFLFRTTEQIRRDNPQLQAFAEYGDLLEAIKQVL
ncbi:MAG: bifunctional phosphoserine phosphatase/homoserine phosphotransferase ThrH [Firmicutes bacterium]|nr:bifunctional phosphoserine phosphatase/homoserine phosphotransferase ThrH [Bacillota bacterium]